MKVQVYMGSFKLLEKSGIGRAILHQKEVLKRQNIEVTDKMEEDVDIVHINTIMLNSVFTALKAKIKNKKIVYYGHSTMEDFKNSFKGSNILAPFFKQWIKLCYRLGDVIITPTDYSKKILDSYNLKKKIFALTNGIDTDYFFPDLQNKKVFKEKYNILENQKVVISVGHFMERKGIVDFIELAKKNPSIKFIWFGHTSDSLLTNIVKNAMKNIPENILFPGYISRDELRIAYQSADLFIFMSHEETEGIVVLEALACEIPTIVRNIPVYDGWLKDGENIHKANSNEEFYLKTIGILNGTEKSYVTEGKKVANERSILAVGKKLKLIYEQLEPKDIIFENDNI